MAAAVFEITMSVPKDLLWKVITDVNAYPQFVKEVVTARKENETSQSFDGFFELELLKRFSYRLVFTRQGHEELHWKLAESDFFKKNEGFWKLEAEGDHTKATYSLDVDFGFLVPSWVTKKLTQNQLPEMVKSFEKRCLALLAERK